MQAEASPQRQAIEAKLREVCPPPSSRIKLNVGGKLFATSIDTLRTREPGSFLAALVSDEWKGDLDEQGAFFIDRDGKYFRVLLNYLRTGELVLPQDKSARRELELELDFYQFENAKAAPVVAREPFAESVLLRTEDHRKTLAEWFQQSSGTTSVPDCQLLYRMSRDGPDADAFYARCEGRGQTFLIARTSGVTTSHLFGGYASGPWVRGEAAADSKSFIFTLTNPFSVPPTKYTVVEAYPSPTVRSAPAGPTWGSAHDLAFGQTLTSATCNRLRGESTGGRAHNLLAGSGTISVAEVEVWACKAQE